MSKCIIFVNPPLRNLASVKTPNLPPRPPHTMLRWGPVGPVKQKNGSTPSAQHCIRGAGGRPNETFTEARLRKGLYDKDSKNEGALNKPNAGIGWGPGCAHGGAKANHDQRHFLTLCVWSGCVNQLDPALRARHTGPPARPPTIERLAPTYPQ